MAVTWKQLAYISDVVYGVGWDGVIDEAPSKNVVYDEMETKPSKTTAAWSKFIGSGGDYATWAAMIADMPDLIAHAVTVTIKAGTTLTETCELKNKHGLTNAGTITIQAEKYYPTSGIIPTTDSATATTLRDAALATAALGNDYFNGCWVFIVDGTGTDNGFVPITDYIDVTGDVVVASWPGTQPDNTSRYLIVGALIDCGGIRDLGFNSADRSTLLTIKGIGVKDATKWGFYFSACSKSTCYYCGTYGCDREGVTSVYSEYTNIIYCGIVNCNTNNTSASGGVQGGQQGYLYVGYCGLSENGQRGIFIQYAGFGYSQNNFGDLNGTWGTYAQKSGQAYCLGTECSGSSGNHSDTGTAGNNNADQAAAY